MIEYLIFDGQIIVFLILIEMNSNDEILHVF